MSSKSKTLANSSCKSDLSGYEALDRDNDNATLAGAKKVWLDLRAAAKHESKKKNLDLLWEVLEGMRKSGSEKFTIAEVGRALEQKGGPKVQSLRNAQGSDFRKIIESYVEAVTVGQSEASATAMERAISMIPDSSLRSILRAGQSELARLKSENDMLRKAFKALSLPSGPSIQSNQANLSESEYLPANEVEFGGFRLKPSQLKALNKGLDHGRLAERGMSIRDDGAIIDEHGTALFPPGFATAILALLAGQHDT